MPLPRLQALRGRGHHFASRVRRRLADQRLPVISVVVTAKASQVPFLTECLESVSGQTWRRLEILIVPCGDDHRSVIDQVQSMVREQRRMALVDAVGTRTTGAARNLGAARASGEFVVFVGGADVLPPPALETLVASLQESGSDFARGAVLLDGARPGVLGPGAMVDPVSRATLDEVPLALTEIFVEGTLFRRGFWSGRTFPDSDGPELDVSVVRAYIEAKAFDVVAGAGYRFMNRGSGRIIGLEKDELEDLDVRLAAQDQIRDLLEDTGVVVRHAWLMGVFRSSVKPLLENVERATPEQWDRIRETVQGMIAVGGEGLLAQVAVVPRLLVWLASQDRRADLEDVVAERRFSGDDFPTVVEDCTVYAQLPLFRDPDRSVPDEMFSLSVGETPLAASLRDITWRADGSLELDVVALIRYVPMEHEPPGVVVRLIDPVSGRSVQPTVRQRTDRDATRFGAMPWQNFDHGAVTVVVDPVELVSSSPGDERVAWQVDIELTASGVTRRGTVGHRVAVGGAAVPHPRTVVGRVVSLPAVAGPVSVVVESPRPILLEAGIDGRTATGVILCPDAAPSRLVATRGHLRVTVPLTRTDGGQRFRADLPAGADTLEPADRSWALHVDSASGSAPVVWTEGPQAWWCNGPSSELAFHRTARGQVALMEVRGLAQVDEAVIADSSLTVRGTWLGRPLERWNLALRGPRLRLLGTVVSQDDHGRFEVRLPLVLDEWGTGAAPVPSDTYRLVLSREGPAGVAQDQPLMVGADLEGRLPVDQVNSSFRMRLGRGAAGRPFVRLQKPYAEDELGPWAQQQLRSAYQVSAPPIDENAVYLQSYDGQTATDSPLALHQELRRTHPHLRLYWGVADRSSMLPEGAVPLLTFTREWYDVLARARYLVNNIDFPRWFARKPGQQLLQTFHGYPAKSMGIRMWQAKNFTPRRIRAELDRTSRDWDLILTPAPEMDQYYRTEYAYNGPIFSHGYPRDDILVSDQAAAVRQRTRELLGIQDHQVAVLYAPTWRDDLATSYRSSPLVRHLDLEVSSQQLGDDFVLLMRGHRFHPGQERSSGDARLIDVTHYPEINDLILATDAAVLDYSSLRFDFALTGRPMLFLVPDLEHYAGGARGFLYPFEDSAPGPLIQHADTVVDLLRDLDRVREDHREAYARFNQTYNYLQDGRSAEHVVAAFFGPGTGVPPP